MYKMQSRGHSRVPRDPHIRVEAARLYDGRCVITGSHIVDICHLIPIAPATHHERLARDWAISQGHAVAESPNNMILLTPTLHRALDRHMFSFQPSLLGGPGTYSILLHGPSDEHLSEILAKRQSVHLPHLLPEAVEIQHKACMFKHHPPRSARNMRSQAALSCPYCEPGYSCLNHCTECDEDQFDFCRRHCSACCSDHFCVDHMDDLIEELSRKSGIRPWGAGDRSSFRAHGKAKEDDMHHPRSHTPIRSPSPQNKNWPSLEAEFFRCLLDTWVGEPIYTFHTAKVYDMYKDYAHKTGATKVKVLASFTQEVVTNMGPAMGITRPPGTQGRIMIDGVRGCGIIIDFLKLGQTIGIKKGWAVYIRADETRRSDDSVISEINRQQACCIEFAQRYGMSPVAGAQQIFTDRCAANVPLDMRPGLQALLCSRAFGILCTDHLRLSDSTEDLLAWLRKTGIETHSIREGPAAVGLPIDMSEKEDTADAAGND
jgi:hypothetical protein